MTAPDPLHVRGYQFVIDGHEKNAARAFAAIKQATASLEGSLDQRVLALGDALNLARDVAELISHLSALRALDEVMFLTTDPDTEEKR